MNTEEAKKTIAQERERSQATNLLPLLLDVVAEIKATNDTINAMVQAATQTEKETFRAEMFQISAKVAGSRRSIVALLEQIRQKQENVNRWEKETSFRVNK